MLIEGNQRSEGCRPQASMASRAYSNRPKWESTLLVPKVNVKGATKLLKDGDHIVMNASKGTIQCLR